MTTTQRWEPYATTSAQARRGNAPATAGFWLGVAGMVAAFLPVVGLMVTIPAAALSHAGRARFRTGRADGPGRSGAGMVLGWTGTAVCGLLSVLTIVAVANAPAPVQVPVAAASAPAAPTLRTVPGVVGLGDRQARDVLRTAGFTHVVLGPAGAPAPGVAAGTVTAQRPGAGVQAGPDTPIVLDEAAAPPAPPAPPVVSTAPVVQEPVRTPRTATEPVTRAPAHAAAPGTGSRVDRPAAPQRGDSSGSTPAGSSGSAGGSGPYANCTAARTAGAAPLYRGQAGYAPKLDRDGDGVACE